MILKNSDIAYRTVPRGTEAPSQSDPLAIWREHMMPDRSDLVARWVCSTWNALHPQIAPHYPSVDNKAGEKKWHGIGLFHVERISASRLTKYLSPLQQDCTPILFPYDHRLFRM